MVAVKTSYTVEEFANYLASNVLLDAAEPLGWGPYVPYVPPGIETKTVSSNTAASPSVLTLSAGLVHAAPAGATLITEDGLTAKTLNSEAIGATVIEIDIPLTLNAWATKDIAIVYSNPVAPVPNPKYVSIVDEALRQMGLEDIENINATNVRELRIRGRLELLRRVAEDRTYQYDYITGFNQVDVDGNPLDVSHQPTDITNHILKLYDEEVNRFSRELFPQAVVEVEIINEGVPEFLSSSEGVEVTW